jgi:hypothetical protein
LCLGLRRGQTATIETQRANAGVACDHVAAIALRHDLVISHRAVARTLGSVLAHIVDGCALSTLQMSACSETAEVRFTVSRLAVVGFAVGGLRV